MAVHICAHKQSVTVLDRFSILLSGFKEHWHQVRSKSSWEQACANTPETAWTHTALGLSRWEDCDREDWEKDEKAMGHSAVDMDSCMRNEMGPGGLYLFLSFVVWLWSVIWHYWGVGIFGCESFPASDRYEVAEKVGRKNLRHSNLSFLAVHMWDFLCGDFYKLYTAYSILRYIIHKKNKPESTWKEKKLHNSFTERLLSYWMYDMADLQAWVYLLIVSFLIKVFLKYVSFIAFVCCVVPRTQF